MDLNVNNDDYREIGSGRVVISESSIFDPHSDPHNPESIDDYCRY